MLPCAALADFHLLDFGGRFSRRFDGFPGTFAARAPQVVS
jgi:hypothetical protein